MAQFDEFVPFWFPLLTRSYKDKVSGDVKIGVGFLGEIDDGIKSTIAAFAKVNLHARIVHTDDPADDIFYNQITVDAAEHVDPSVFDSTTDISETINAADVKLNHNQLMGMLTVEIVGANNLPMQKNVIRSTFNCDPFTILSFGKKTFKTRLIRHSLNPQWNESCFLHVKTHEFDADYKVCVD